MPQFSKRSMEKLNTCDAKLIQLFSEVVRHYDCTILEGHRNKEDQNKYFLEGKSKFRWPNSKHNRFPSYSVDAIFYPFSEYSWNDREKFMEFRGFVYGIASQLGIILNKTIEWDLPHFELRG